MAYDFHGSWDRSTGFSAPLYPEPNVSEKNRYLNVNASIHAWLSRGADPRKLVLGIPLYSRTFTLENPAENGVGAPARGPGRKGPYTREAGTLGFNEICELQSGGQYAENWDDNQKVPFAAQGDQWIGYDNQRSAGLKVQLARDLGLAGVMVWSLETDDFRAKCSSVTGSGAFPMLKAIRQALESGTPPPPSPTTPSPELPCVSATSTPFSTSTTNAAVCTRIGNVRDPDDCAVFYKCAHIGQPLYQYKFTCQTGLYFDEALQLCNWKNQVKCP